METNPELRNLQLLEAEALQDLADFCEKNNIAYSLDSGTLLGAVRHSGFIPWDDDIDLTMPFPDYCRFLELAPKGLGSRYYVQCSAHDKTFHRFYTRVRINQTSMIRLDHLQSKAHQGIWIDIFPIAAIQSKIDWKITKAIISFSNYMMIDDWMLGYEDEFKKTLKWSYPLLCAFLKIPLEKRQKWHTKIVRYVCREKKRAKYEGHVWGNITRIYPKGILTGSKTKLPFEGREYSVYSEYDQYLKTAYGDYMQLPPEEKRYNHITSVYVDLERDYSVVLPELQKTHKD